MLFDYGIYILIIEHTYTFLSMIFLATVKTFKLLVIYYLIAIIKLYFLQFPLQQSKMPENYCRH